MLKKAWVLIDDRTGSSNQAIALANILGVQYEIKKLEYNILAHLPNFLHLGLCIIKNKKDFINEEFIPDIVISAGRRSALIALALKNMKQSLKLFHIMKPGINISKFDLVILPEHDRSPEFSKHKNVFYINGAITYVKPKIKKAAELWEKLIDEEMYPSPKIGVLIGGQSKGCKFYVGHAKNLADRLIKSARELNGSLLVTTSRRTPQQVTNILKKMFRDANDVRTYFYDAKSGKDNPYHGILGLSDYIVVTGDSINMCCEGIEAGSPVFVFYDENMLSKKHQRFIQALIFNKMALRFEDRLYKFQHKTLLTSQIIKNNIKPML